MTNRKAGEGEGKSFVGLGDERAHHTQLRLASVIKTIITDLTVWLQL